MRSSFTMMELIFVIVILGILGGLGSDILKNAYQNYAMQRSISNLQLKTANTLDLISAYLQNAIHPSVAVDGDTLDYEYIAYVTRGGESDIDSNKTLVWIGKDTESIRGIWDESQNHPAYSGLADIENSDGVNVIVLDSDLGNLDDVQDTLTGSGTDRQGGTWDETALYFVYANANGDAKSRFWNFSAAASPSEPSSLFQISAINSASDQITLASQPEQLSERFYLVYSAYAIRYADNNVDGNLTLTWKFHPWENEDYTHANAETHTIVSDVTSFEVWGESGGSVIRLRLCVTDQQLKTILDDDTFEYCKEAAVIR